MQNVLSKLEPSVLMRMLGAGNKAVNMLDEYGDIFIHVVKGIKFWDMCAPEALVRARFGIMTDKDKKPIIYESNLKDYTITNGILMARSQAIYDLCC